MKGPGMIVSWPVRLVLAAGFRGVVGLLGSAQSVRLLGDFRDWSAYATSDSGGQDLLRTVQADGDRTRSPTDYGQAYLYLTHRPAETRPQRVQPRRRLHLRPGFRKPSCRSAAMRFALFTSDDAAWLLDPAQSDNVAGAMRAGTSLIVEGTNERGIKIRQTFSLLGRHRRLARH